VNEDFGGRVELGVGFRNEDRDGNRGVGVCTRAVKATNTRIEDEHK